MVTTNQLGLTQFNFGTAIYCAPISPSPTYKTLSTAIGAITRHKFPKYEPLEIHLRRSYRNQILFKAISRLQLSYGILPATLDFASLDTA